MDWLRHLAHEQEFWFAVAFVFFIGTAFKPLKKMLTGTLDARAAKAHAEVEEARRLRAEAQALLDEYRSKQSQAAKDAADILAAAKDEAELMRQEAEAELKRTLAAREAQAMDRIAFAEQAAIQSVKARAVEIAVRAATELVRDAIDANAANTLVDQAIEELPRRARA
jgi:F-type H+-transporting ATPase subunit b